MTILLKSIEKELRAARILKDTFSVKILSTLLGEIQNKLHGQITDEAIIALIKKFSNNAQELARISGRSVTAELEIYDKFIPQQLTKGEISVIILDENLTNMKDAMAYFKTHYASRFNAADVKSCL